jgi:hypothetical protein
VVQVAAPAPPSKPSPAPEQKAVSKKRRGPLPAFLAELLVLGFYAAFFTAITKYNAEVRCSTPFLAKLLNLWPHRGCLAS